MNFFNAEKKDRMWMLFEMLCFCTKCWSLSRIYCMVKNCTEWLLLVVWVVLTESTKCYLWTAIMYLLHCPTTYLFSLLQFFPHLIFFFFFYLKWVEPIHSILCRWVADMSVQKIVRISFFLKWSVLNECPDLVTWTSKNLKVPHQLTLLTLSVIEFKYWSKSSGFL